MIGKIPERRFFTLGIGHDERIDDLDTSQWARPNLLSTNRRRIWFSIEDAGAAEVIGIFRDSRHVRRSSVVSKANVFHADSTNVHAQKRLPGKTELNLDTPMDNWMEEINK